MRLPRAQTSVDNFMVAAVVAGFYRAAVALVCQWPCQGGYKLKELEGFYPFLVKYRMAGLGLAYVSAMLHCKHPGVVNVFSSKPVGGVFTARYQVT